jgi:hypothetical protein
VRLLKTLYEMNKENGISETGQCGRCSDYSADWVEEESLLDFRYGRDFLYLRGPPVRPSSPSTFPLNGYWKLISLQQRGKGVKLTSHLFLVPGLIISGVTAPLVHMF